MSMRGSLAIMAAFSMLGASADIWDDRNHSTNPGPILINKRSGLDCPVFGTNQNQPIPNGCIKESIVLSRVKDHYQFSIMVDVIYGSQKSKDKKLVKLMHEYSQFIFGKQTAILLDSKQLIVNRVNI